MNLNMQQFIQALPKCELHAHLSGSIRDSLLNKLLARERSASLRSRASGVLNKSRTLDECFQVFDLLHLLIDDADTLRECVHHVLHDFEKDNVLYLELRTTPRSAFGVEPRDYVHIVLDAVHEYQMNNTQGLVCRVLLSVDRAQPVLNGERTLELVKEIKARGGPRSEMLVGLELSGNPTKNQWSDYRHIFEKARRELRIPISLHFAEVPNMGDEALSMLQFRPERLGHAAIIDSTEIQALLLESAIPVEVCLTSNLQTKACKQLKLHSAISVLKPNGHPFAVCTDDSGVFNISLSHEYCLLASALNLSRQECAHIALSAFEHVMCSDETVMREIRNRAKHMVNTLLKEDTE